MKNKDYFKRNVGVAHRVIRTHLAKNPKLIVHGSRSQNVQLPRYLERKATFDWDIFSKTPKKSATKLERKLDKKFGGDYFRVKPGATKRLKVNKVISNVTEQSFADFSIPDRIVPTTSIRGKMFATLRDQKLKAQSNIKDPTKSFRREKDLNFLRRVKIFEKMRGRKI